MKPIPWNDLINRKMIVALIMGFSCGLPLLLTGSVLQAWMVAEGLDLTLIGLMALVGLPYTIKFLWAPFLDRYTLPFLGRRRGWMLTAQGLLLFTIAGLGLFNPGNSPWLVALAALVASFFSASQDVVVDAYRREDLSDRELGLGSSLYVNGYRLGMLLAGGGGLVLADRISFSWVYPVMAACMLPGLLTTALTPEPATPGGIPQTLRQAALGPLREYFARPLAGRILAFILLYKIGDTMAGAMTMPFYLDLGYSMTQIGTVANLFGFWATIGGGLAGGLLMLRMGIHRSLWIFGLLQALSTGCFALLASMGVNISALAAIIAFENVSSGMGTAAYAAFLASITHKRYTATQYALLSSLMGVPRVLMSSLTGYMATQVGWVAFFLFCMGIAIPGLFILRTLNEWAANARGRDANTV